MRKAMTVAMLLLAMLEASADESKPRSWTSRTNLWTECDNIQDQFSTGACLGYVVAAAEIADGGYLQGHRTCIPKGITEGRLQEVVRRYLDKHPEYKGYIGYQVVVVSLVEAFPCPTQ
jgi:Ssp1 endopeptidase immunity protein Rap1a